MPILIDSIDFIDVFGTVTPFYVSDTGDKITVQFNLRSSIRMSSVGNPLTLDPSVNTVQSAGLSWIDEGFRVNDIVRVIIHNSGGSPVPGPNGTFWTQINYVDDITADFSGIPEWYNITQQEFVTLVVVEAIGSNVYKSRDDLDVLFNHSKNSSPGSEFSLIDAEATRVQFQGVAALPVAGTVAGLLIGNQSGSFLTSGELLRNPNNADGWLQHRVTLIFANPGIYDDGTWFFSSECLKIFTKFLWARIAGEPFARATAIYNLEANTGWFNEPFNSGVNNGVLLQGISELDYCIPTTFDIIVDGELLNIGLGAGYRSINDAYYKNKPQSQNNLTMIIATDIINNFLATISSTQNPSGAGYDIKLNTLIQIGSVTTANITFTPNAAFTTFMDGVEDGDRQFYLWIKCGNLNLLAFNGQLSCAPPVGGPLPMLTDWGYLDHSEQVTTANGVLTGFEADTEDDIAYFGTFLLDKGQIYESFSVKMEAFNILTGEDFTLQIATFGFGGIQISGLGVYLLNESQTINSTLPTTSVKREALLQLEPTLDTPTQYGVKIYAPWILDWKYWLPLLGASVDFYPTQDKNWEQYDNLANWILRTELTLIKDGLAYVHDNQIIDLKYDANDNIDSNIDLIVDATNLIVNVVPVGSLMRVKATHINLLGAWGVNTWGMVTVEAFESSPRWICSTVVPFDNNTANPLLPLSGSVIPIQFPAPNIAVLECYFDPNLINLSNGVKFTSKIKDPDVPPIPYEFLVEGVKEAQLLYSIAYKLSPLSVYSGACLRVRRGLDNAEMDIPFNNVELDQIALLNFVGNGIDDRGWIVTIYDQSGWGIDATASTFAEQPLIVEFGAVNLGLNGKPAALCNGTTNGFGLNQLVPAQPYLTSHFVFDRAKTAINNFSLSASNIAPFVIAFTFVDRVVDLIGAAANQWQAGVDLSTGNILLTISRDGMTFDTIVNKDGVAMPLSPINVPPNGGNFDSLLKRTAPATFHSGNFQEFVLFSNDQSANVTTQENNIKNRYNIP